MVQHDNTIDSDDCLQEVTVAESCDLHLPNHFLFDWLPTPHHPYGVKLSQRDKVR